MNQPPIVCRHKGCFKKGAKRPYCTASCNKKKGATHQHHRKCSCEHMQVFQPGFPNSNCCKRFQCFHFLPKTSSFQSRSLASHFHIINFCQSGCTLHLYYFIKHDQVVNILKKNYHTSVLNVAFTFLTNQCLFTNHLFDFSVTKN